MQTTMSPEFVDWRIFEAEFCHLNTGNPNLAFFPVSDPKTGGRGQIGGIILVSFHSHYPLFQ